MFLILTLAVAALVLARVAGAPKDVWKAVLAGAVALILGSQFLASGHPLRVDLAANARLAFWIAVAAIPVGAYWFFLRRIRRRTGADALGKAGPRPVGLVRIDDDRALAFETRAALEGEAPPGTGFLSLAWRDPGGDIVGHVRIRRFAEAAEIETIRVEPERRGEGTGARLLAAAEREARAGGVVRMHVAPGDWQAPGFFARAGYRVESESGLGGGRRRLRMTKEIR